MQQRVDATGKGSWKAFIAGPGDSFDSVITLVGDGVREPDIYVYRDEAVASDADFEFIAAARQDVPRFDANSTLRPGPSSTSHQLGRTKHPGSAPGRGCVRSSRIYRRWVIDDSQPWRDELVKVADRLEAKTKQKRWTDRTGHLIERDFVVGAYAMRKLVEAHRVSEELKGFQFPVRRFELLGKKPDSRFPDDIADFYDFENGRRQTLSVVDLCQHIVHSCIFAFYCGETADLFDGVFLSSDRQKNKYVYLVLSSDFIALCWDIGAGDV
jgi:hypothetical protein